MTDARLVSKTPEGSGLTHGLLDDYYEKRRKGIPIDAIPVVGLLKVSGSGDNDTSKGTSRHVKLEFIRLEPVKDPGDAEQIAWQITRADDIRHRPTGQTELPLSNSPAERRLSLLEDLSEWASDNGVTEDELDVKFVDMLGGPEHAAAEKVQDASLVHLLEFVGYVTQGSKQQTLVPAPEFSGTGEDET
jgi:hypothetical protein